MGAQSTALSVMGTVNHLKSFGVDFEWYPTTDEQLDVIKADLLSQLPYHLRELQIPTVSVLDIGAGNGKALLYLTKGTRYAIEKAMPLVEQMDKSIFVIGSDFHNNTLIDKKVDVVFCNPPYSEYAQWASKVIKEANAGYVYLILPTRWEQNTVIKEALDTRKVKATVLGEYDYHDAERAARATVHVIRMTLGFVSRGETTPDSDPFDIWFDEQFPLDTFKDERSAYSKMREVEAKIEREMAKQGAGELVKSEGLLKTLVRIYDGELQSLLETYKTLCTINGELLRELDINIKNVKAALKLKVTSLKDVFWQRLFNSLDQITNKLCTASRKQLLDKLTRHTHVDFNEENAVAVVIWILKQANQYFDDQIIETFETLTELAHIKLYKSNERTIGKDRWRYRSDRFAGLGPYGLDYRLVLAHCGGYVEDTWRCTYRCSLSDNAVNLVNDLVTLANNIGFDAVGNVLAQEKQWQAGKPQYFYFWDHGKNEKTVLFEVKAFKNGNLHVRLNEGFIQQLNVVHGRLKGWLRSAQEAVDELNISPEVATQAFNVNLRIEKKDIPLLALPSATQAA